MTLRRRRNNGSPDDDATQWLTPLLTDPADGTTYQWGGASDVGVMTISITGTAPLNGYQPPPASYPALEAAPQPRDVLAPVPVTEPAKFGDDLRRPLVWCEMPGCINWGYEDTPSAGFADSRRSAINAGWRYDAFGRLACAECQQTRADYYTPQPVTVQHPGIPRRWHEHGTLPSEDTRDRLTGAADYARYVRRAHPEWAAAMAGASDRTVTALCGPT